MGVTGEELKGGGVFSSCKDQIPEEWRGREAEKGATKIFQLFPLNVSSWFLHKNVSEVVFVLLLGQNLNPPTEGQHHCRETSPKVMSRNGGTMPERKYIQRRFWNIPASLSNVADTLMREAVLSEGINATSLAPDAHRFLHVL